MWFEGWSAGQSILTCVYLHNMKSLREASDYEQPQNIVKYFHGFANGLLLLKKVVDDVMSRTSCREGEEFSSDTCGFIVEADANDTEIIQNLEILENQLNARLSPSNALEPLQSSAEIEKNVVSALLSRISFIKVCILVLPSI